MRRSMIVAALVTAAVAIAYAGGDDAKPSESPVPLKDVEGRGIEGRLGVWLGTIVEVSGRVVERGSPRSKEGSRLFLRITDVNGRALPEPVFYPFRKANQWVECEEPKLGETFRLVGYETGGYEGAAPGEFDYVRAYATMGFHFATRFAVLAAKGRSD